jgi:hypothetical protein
MATQWLDAEFDIIHRLAMMLDAEAQGEGGVVLRREIRYLENAFGLNPGARQRLRWKVGEEGADKVQPDPCVRMCRSNAARPVHPFAVTTSQ